MRNSGVVPLECNTFNYDLNSNKITEMNLYHVYLILIEGN